MPWTRAGQEALNKITRDSEAFAAKYDSVPYKQIPIEERKAQKDRDIAIRVADRSAAFAEGKGPLFDALCFENCNKVDQAERDRLWFQEYGLRGSAQRVEAA